MTEALAHTIADATTEAILIPKDAEEIRLELHCDWLDMRTARHWAAEDSA